LWGYYDKQKPNLLRLPEKQMRSLNGQMTERRIEIDIPLYAKYLYFLPPNHIRDFLEDQCSNWRILEAHRRKLISKEEARDLIRILHAPIVLRMWWSVLDLFRLGHWNKAVS
jgi:hypothetical protein